MHLKTEAVANSGEKHVFAAEGSDEAGAGELYCSSVPKSPKLRKERGGRGAKVQEEGQVCTPAIVCR